MKLQPLALAVALGLSGSAAASPWVTVDARSAGMGGLSVVTSNIDSAAFTNPAMLAAGQEDDDFGIVVTGGITAGDPNDFAGALNSFQTAMTALAGMPIQTNLDAAVAALANLQGKGLVADLGYGAASSFKWGQWAAAVSVSMTSANEIGVDSSDGNPLTVDAFGNTNAIVGAVSVNTQDVALSLARNFELSPDFDLAVGVTPKMQNISVGEGSQSFNISDPSNLTGFNIAYDSAAASLNADVGVVGRYKKDIKFGLVGRNMLASSFTTTGGRTVEMQPQMRAGVAYNHRLFTVGVDMDLTENTGYISGAKSKYMIIGTEINAWGLAQLRLGQRSNTLDANDVQQSVGFGLFNAINIGVMTNPNNPTAGVSGFVSFGFKI